jgi:hypothetical protein
MVGSHWRQAYLKTLVKHVSIPKDTLDWWELIDEFKESIHNKQHKSIIGGLVSSWAKKTNATIEDVLQWNKKREVVKKLILDLIDYRIKKDSSKKRVSINSLCN